MGRMIRPLSLRLFQGVGVAVAISSLTFLVVNLTPGDLALRIAVARHGLDAATPEAVEQIRREEGLGDPLLSRYLRWLARTARMDLGRSLVDGRPVRGELAHRFSYSLRLGAASLLLSFSLALPLGIASGLHPRGRLNAACELVSTAMLSLPCFVSGVLLILVFAVLLHWLPVAGFTGVRALVLPSVTLGIGLAAVSNRIIATSVAGVRGRFYYRFARMKGLDRRQAILRHGVRNAAVPVLTVLGLQFAHLLDWAVIVETLFAWPGIGRFLWEGILARDIPVVQGAALLIGFTYVAVNASVDLLCLLLSPGRNPEEGIT